MPITLDYTTIHACDSETNWTVIGEGQSIGTSAYPSKEGSSCLEFSLAASVTGGYKSPVLGSGEEFDLRDYEVGMWFLNPKYNTDDEELIGTGDDDLVLRVYSGSNYADFNQGHLKQGDGTYPGGWMYLRASGGPGAESTNSGTWGTAQVSSIDAVGIVVTSQANNYDKSDSEPEYGFDWVKYYSKINVDDYNGSSAQDAWTLADILAADEDKSTGGGVWGVVNNVENFYRFFCGLEFGDSSGGEFVSENEYIYFDPSSADVDYDILINSGFTVTLGQKNSESGAVADYAQNGVQVVVKNEPLFQGDSSGPPESRPSFKVDSGGVLKGYASLIKGFGTVNFGDGGTSLIDFIKMDLFDNDTVELRSTGLDWEDVRLHFPEGQEGDIGKIYSVPTLLKIDSFQVADGLECRVNVTIEEYKAGDSTYDIVVLEGTTVTLRNSTFSTSKLKRVAS